MPAGLFAKPAHYGRLVFNDFTAAFDQLSPEQREVLILVGASGFSHGEAAGMMGVACGTVKSRANRARGASGSACRDGRGRGGSCRCRWRHSGRDGKIGNAGRMIEAPGRAPRLTDRLGFLREAAAAYERMTDTILHDEAELEDVIHQKEGLLREVPHRVKNNLQLIASILNLRIRQARSPGVKAMMKTLQDRVPSLATIHRALCQTSGLTDVRADELLPDIVRQVLNFGTGPGRRFEVETAFDDLRLTPDQAVPLSLLMTELPANALKYGGPSADGRARLRPRLWPPPPLAPLRRAAP